MEAVIISESIAAKVYPGLLCNSLEFFKDGNMTRFFNEGRVKPFYELPSFYIQVIKEYIENNPEVERALMVMEPNSEIKRLEKFCQCRFGGLDFNPDIKDGKLQEGDYWECPVRDICPAAGLVCVPLKYGGQVISAREIKLIKNLVTDLTNETIAEEMFMPLGTFHLHKKKLYNKLKIKTKQELTLIAVKLNILP
jgi:hypothetical protein